MGEAVTLTHCNNACPTCCSETLAELEIRSEIEVRKEYLVLSKNAIYGMLLASVVHYFVYKTELPFPAIMWAIAMGPLLGHGASRLIGFIEKIGVKK